ncbi:hypothetical protein ACVWW4_004193 [Bradyrhizobium sp. LB7.1]
MVIDNYSTGFFSLRQEPELHANLSSVFWIFIRVTNPIFDVRVGRFNMEASHPEGTLDASSKNNSKRASCLNAPTSLTNFVV